MGKMKCSLMTTICVILIANVIAVGQERTVGLFINEDDAYVGYTLFSPMSYTVSYLIDNNGLLINSWQSDYRPAMMAYVLENGNLLRTGKHSGNPEFALGGGAGGYLQEFEWDGILVWNFLYSDSLYCPHHDIEPLPNGNLLVIAWEYKSAAEAIAAGRNPNLLGQGKLWPEHIIEVQPDGQTGGIIVWEWHMWDHLIQDYDSTRANYGIVDDHPELMNINFAYNNRADWSHFNSIDYNEALDQILISAHAPSEILILDHSTTTAEAAGHTGGIYGKGGDFLYRWGNPRAYRAGQESDRQLFKQHDAGWIEPGYPGAGNILIFNNGNDRPGGNYSSVDEIVPPIDSSGNYYLAPDSAYGPEEPVWVYTAENPTDFYAQNLCGAHRLPNGNTLITDGRTGTFFEITLNDSLVWLYVNPVNSSGPVYQGDPPLNNNVFWATRYTPDYPGFDGQNMTPGDPIELYPTDISYNKDILPGVFSLSQNYPNPFNANTTIEFRLNKPHYVKLSVYDLLGRENQVLMAKEKQAGSYRVTFDASGLSSGVYFYRLQAGDISETQRMIILK